MSMDRSATLLVVEDSDTIREVVAATLRRAGYDVVTAADGETAVALFHRDRPDAVVLDVWLPGRDGWWVLERLRETDEAVPVLLLTSLQDEPSKVRGLMGGADDFVVKPVGAGELVARVAALLRRHRSPGAAVPDSVYADERLRIDFASNEVVVGGIPVSLTPMEFRLLATFVRRAGQTLSPRDLMELVWNDYTGTTRDSVKVYIGYLRKKLGAADGGAELIETVRGFGYRYAGAD